MIASGNELNAKRHQYLKRSEGVDRVKREGARTEESTSKEYYFVRNQPNLRANEQSKDGMAATALTVHRGLGYTAIVVSCQQHLKPSMTGQKQLYSPLEVQQMEDFE